jgi:phosphoribosylaminoimidazole-succinocarboxamide synthase
MAELTGRYPEGAPRVNFERGLYSVDLWPRLGEPSRGKVRDNWMFPWHYPDGEKDTRVQVTTDRKSAFNKKICTIPGVGQVLNEISAFNFRLIEHIVPSHMIAIPHPNVLIGEPAEPLPVEIITRKYISRTSTETSIYRQYFVHGRREIYGIKFPDGLRPNQELPMGTIITPTTKSEGDDQELTDEQARAIVDGQFGRGVWEMTKKKVTAVDEYLREYYLQRGIIDADGKSEYGINKNGELMIIDEKSTPDTNRFWLAETYQERFEAGEDPDAFDKEIMRKALAEKGFTGQGPIPALDIETADKIAQAYNDVFTMITGRILPAPETDPKKLQDQIRLAVADYLLAA